MKISFFFPVRRALRQSSRPWKSAGLIFTILAIFAGAPAQAQFIQWPSVVSNPNKPLYEQPRPDYDPIGISLGSFLFKPSLSDNVVGDDDIFASEVRPASDLINTTQEDFKLDSQWTRHLLSVDLFSEQQVYTQHPSESANTYMGTITARYDLSSGGQIEFNGTGGQEPQVRASEEAFQPQGHRPVFNVWIGTLTYTQHIEQFVNQFRLNFNQNAYIFLQNIYQSNIDKVIGDRLAWDYGQLLVPFVEAGYDVNSQVFHPEFQNFQNLTISGGFRTHIDDVLDAELSAGFLRETFRNPLFRALESPVVKGSLLWNITPLTSITGNVFFDRSGVESFCNTGVICQLDLNGNNIPVVGTLPPGNPFFSTHRSTAQRFSSQLGVQHEIWHNILGSLNAGYQHYSFDFNGLTDNLYSAGGNLRYLLNNYSEIEISYQYRSRSANLPLDYTFNTGPFKENIVSMKATLQL